MSDPTSAEKRLLRVTAGNLRQNHLYVKGHLDFFPADAVGGAKRSGNGSALIEIVLDGLDETVATDIGRDAKTGKPRGFLRGRGWVRRFYKHHNVKAGSLVALERISERRYSLRVEKESDTPTADARAVRRRRAPSPASDMGEVHEIATKNGGNPVCGLGRRLRFIDLFCGIGGFRIAFERAGCRCVFSSDWDKFSRQAYAGDHGLKICWK